MEAEALAKLRKERPIGCQESLQMLSNARHKVPSFIRQDHDLMVFPESELKGKANDKLLSIDIDKLTNAELETLLLDDNFEVSKTLKPPPTLPVAPIFSPSLSSQYYTQPPYQGGQWTPAFRGPVPCTLPRVYSSTFPKQVDPFQNGFPPSMSTYRSREPVYLSLPGRTPYMPFSVQSIAPFHVRGSLPTYSPPVTPSIAKLFDKIAVTSEFQKNGKLAIDAASSITQDTFPATESPKLSSDISKFDWLDLDPLSKPKVENSEIPHHAVDADGKNLCVLVAEDPWDKVLSEEKPVETFPHERKLSGKSPSGASVTRSQSLNLRLTQSQLTKLQSQSSQVRIIY